MKFREFVNSELEKRNMTYSALCTAADVDPGNTWRLLKGDNPRPYISCATVKKIIKDGLGLSMAVVDELEF